MIIKIIPETDEEKTRFQENFSTNEITHSGVREYFIFGNRIIADGQLVDFHEWTGSPRYLMGNLRYFFEVVNDERREKESNGHIGRQPQAVQHPNIQKLNFPDKNIPRNAEEFENELSKINHPKIVMENKSPKIVKKGEVGNIQTIDVSNLKKNNGLKIVPMSNMDRDPVPNIPNVDRFPYTPNFEDEAKDD